MSPGGEEVSPLNITGWRGFPLRRRVAELTGLPTYVDNDAKALALGEGWVGAAQGQGDFIGMVVSTGVGGGVVLDGRLLSGRLGNAGHVGHVIVVPDGRACPCGGRGCLEAEASGTAIAAITGRPAAEAPPELVERTGRLVGLAIASVVNLLDLPLAVVSGSVALGFGAPFFAAAQAEMDLRCRLDFARGARVVPGGLGDGGPLVGAARVGWRAAPGRWRSGAATVRGRGVAGWTRHVGVVLGAVLWHPSLWWPATGCRATAGPARLVAPGALPSRAGRGVLALPAGDGLRRGRE